jgi:hypothetical protein
MSFIPLIYLGLLHILSKLATQSFFEFVITKVIIYCAEKLSELTTNSVDDELVAEIKRRLQ